VLVGTNINGNEFFPGYLSNLRVSNTALYTGSTLTVPTTPLTSSGSTVLLTCQSNRFVDNSSNAFTATASGTPSVQRFNPFGTATAYSTSVIGGSGYFDGTGDYLSVPTGTGLNLTGDFTIEGWIYVDSSNYYTTIFSNGEYPSTAQVVLVVTDGNQPILYMSNGTVWSVTLSSSISLNKNSWNHLAATASGTNYTIWVNGVSGGTVGTGFTRTTADTTSVVGRLYTVTNNYYTKGYISNVRVVKGTALYTTTFTPSTTPLTAVSGTSLLLNYINGAIFDNAMINDLETVDNAQISTSVVKFGTGSLKFDGGGDYLIGASTPNTNIDGGNFTLEAWVYLSDATQVSPIIAKNFGGAGGYMFWVQSTLRLRVYDSSASATTVTSSASISNNTWTFVAVVRNSDTLTLYINGVADGTASYSSTSTNSAAIEVGGYGSGTASMNGYLDEVRITKGYARYTATFTPPTAAFPNTGPV
jgi:hypothetical protein